MRHPTNAIIWLNFGQTLMLVTGGWTLLGSFAGQGGSPVVRSATGARGLRLALVLYAIALPSVGQSHFVYVKQARRRRFRQGRGLGLISLARLDSAARRRRRPAERALRGLVVGRKNHYGSRSLRGAEVSALFYSLIATARLRRRDPAAYLREALHAALRQASAVTLPL